VVRARCFSRIARRIFSSGMARSVVAFSVIPVLSSFYGYTLKEIADFLGIHYATVNKAVGGRIKK
jgi:DNA-binding MarR family transcriptional regulator